MLTKKKRRIRPPRITPLGEAIAARISAALIELGRRGSGCGDMLAATDRLSAQFHRLPIGQRFALCWVLDESGCWVWTAAIHTSGGGYGVFGYHGRSRRAHRVSYELFVGPIADGLTVDHLCRNTRCVNPAHLDPCTTQENTRRWAVTQDYCRSGRHLKTPENMQVRSTGERLCKPCRAEKNVGYRPRRNERRRERRAEARAAA